MKTSKPLVFKKYHKDGVYNYDLVFYDRVIENRWVCLRDIEKWDRVSSEVFSKKSYYVTPATGEEIVLLPAMTWFMVKNFRYCAIGSSECSHAMAWVERDPDYNARWFYSIDSLFETEPPVVVKGEFEKKECVFWELEDSDDLFCLQAAGIGDVSTGMNILAGNDVDPERINSVLSNPNIDMHKVLDEMGLFVATTYGFDMGYYNGLTIKSPVCIDEQITELEFEFKRRIAEYDYLMGTVETVEEWIPTIRLLATGS